MQATVIYLEDYLKATSSNKIDVNTESVIPPLDSRIRITPTTTEPWSAIVKLYMYFDGVTMEGSGALIDEFHVLTAGHCVYDYGDEGYARRIVVVPGKDGDSEPYGYAWVTQNRTYSQWVSSGDDRHDMALLTLDRTVGDFAGYMNYTTKDDTDAIYQDFFNITGYPGDLDEGINMYSAENDTGDADEYNQWYKMDTAGGQSGGPVWRQNSTGYYIYAVHTRGGTSYNNGTRINQNKYNNITEWLIDDSFSLPPDKPDMVDRGRDFSGFNVDDELSVWCDIRNIGTDPTGSSFEVSYYLSDDNSITTSDEYLGSDTVPEITEYNYADSGWEGEIPDDLEEGTYFVGWIIDEVEDIDEIIDFIDGDNNNVGYVGSYVLGIGGDDDDDDDDDNGKSSGTTSFIADIVDFLTSPLGMIIVISSMVGLIIIAIVGIKLKKRYYKIIKKKKNLL